MKLEKVLTTTGFVLWIEERGRNMDDLTRYLTIVFYAKLMQTPLALEMFVPCKDGKSMEEPGSAPIYTHSKGYITEYKQAQEKVLFEGLDYFQPTDILPNKTLVQNNEIIELTKKGWDLNMTKLETIEDLINSNIDLIPTDNFYKKIGL